VTLPFKDAERRREYQRERAQLRRAGRADASAKVSLPDPIRIQTARDVLSLLGEQINQLRADLSLGTVERARALGALAGVALRAVETADLETRLVALEAVLKMRDSH
jgi:hypothetical protein